MSAASPHLALLGDATSVHVQRWAREMLARGWRVSLVTARPQAMDGVEQVVVRPVRRSLDWLGRVGETRRALARLAPDIVHAHYVTSYGYLAARAGRQPLVMTAWGTDLLVTPRQSAAKRWLTAFSLRRARLVTGDSRDLLEAAQQLAPGVATQLIHWGVERERFAPAAWADKPALEAVSLRSWEPNYRIDVIVRAFAQVQAQYSDARLHLLGGGSQEGLCARWWAIFRYGIRCSFTAGWMMPAWPRCWRAANCRSACPRAMRLLCRCWRAWPAAWW